MINVTASYFHRSDQSVIFALDFLMSIREMMVCRGEWCGTIRAWLPASKRIGLRSRPIRQDARRLKRCSSPTGEERP